jgi:hypothetical protein
MFSRETEDAWRHVRRATERGDEKEDAFNLRSEGARPAADRIVWLDTGYNVYQLTSGG